MGSKFPTLLVIATLMAASPGISVDSACAQTPELIFQGKVTDQNGTPIEGVQVVIKNEETGAVRLLTTTSTGRYFAPEYISGKYEISTMHPNYYPQSRKGLRVLVGQSVEADFVLVSRNIELQEVLITASPSLVETKKSEISGIIQPEQVERLPLNSRNWLELAKLVPGIKTATSGGTVAYGALNWRRIGVSLDGSKYKDDFIGGDIGNGNNVPLDALKEVQVITNLFKAEYGKASTMILQGVTQSGTNEFHGSAFNFYRGRDLNAQGAFENEKPDYKRQQQGFSLGGPIVKDALHFFLAYEHWNLKTFSTVVPGNPIFQARYPDQIGTFENPRFLDEGMIRLDWRVSGTQSLMMRWLGRYDLLEANGFGGIDAYSRAFKSVTRVQDYLVTHRMFISSEWLNELRFQYQGFISTLHNLFDGRPELLYKTFRVNQYGIYPQSQPQSQRNYRYLLGEDITHYISDWGGEHAFRAGIQLDRSSFSFNSPFFPTGQFTFLRDDATIPASGLISLGNTETSGLNTQLGVYIQDDWTPFQNLTLNLGLRWDYESNDHNNDFVTPEAVFNDPELQPVKDLGFFSRGRIDRPPYMKAFAPRLGFSWDIFGNQRTALHGGWGIFFDRNLGLEALREQISIDQNIYQVFFKDGGQGGTIPWDPRYAEDPASFRKFVEDAVASGTLTIVPSLSLMPGVVPPPVNRQMAFGINHAISPDIALSVDYIRQRSSREPVRINLNWRRASTGQRAITNKYGNILILVLEGRTEYDALQVSINRLYQRGWQMSFNYILSWSRADTDDRLAMYTLSSSIVSAPFAADERHSLQLSGLIDLPWDLQLSGSIRLATARPYTILTGKDDNDDSALNDDYPPEGRNAGRQDLQPFIWKYMFASRNVDVRLAKTFSIGEFFSGLSPVRVMLIIDAFNVFNWVNYDSQSYIGTPGSALFGKPTAAGDPRQIQLGIRLNL